MSTFIEFNIEAINQELNTQSATPVALSYDHGLIGLRSDRRQQLKLNFDLYDNYSFERNTDFIVYRELVQRYRKSRTNANDQMDLQLIKQLLASRKLLELEIWYKQRSKILQTAWYWECIEKCVVDETQQNKVKKLSRIQIHAKFAHYQCEDLLLIAQEILPTIEQLLQKALADLNKKRKKIYPLLFTKYKVYLENTLAQISGKDTGYNEKERLAEAMLARLEIASETANLKQDDIILWLEEKIYQLTGKLPFKAYPYANKQPRMSMTEKHFVAFHHFIATYGRVETRQGMRQLRWFAVQCADHILPLTKIVLNSAGQFAVPQGYEELVPAFKRSPDWLFKDHNYGYEFFQHYSYQIVLINCIGAQQKQNRLVIIQRINTNSFDVNDQRQFAIMRTFAQLRQSLQQVNACIVTNKRSKLQQLIYRRSTKLIKQWEIQLNRIYSDIIQQQMLYIIAIAKNLEQKNYKLNFYDAKDLLDIKLVAETQALIAEIKKFQGNNDPVLVERFKQAERIYQQAVDGASAFVNFIQPSLHSIQHGNNKHQQAANLKSIIDWVVSRATPYITIEAERQAILTMQQLIKCESDFSMDLEILQQAIRLLFAKMKHPLPEIENMANALIKHFAVGANASEQRQALAV